MLQWSPLGHALRGGTGSPDAEWRNQGIRNARVGDNLHMHSLRHNRNQTSDLLAWKSTVLAWKGAATELLTFFRGFISPMATPLTESNYRSVSDSLYQCPCDLKIKNSKIRIPITSRTKRKSKIPSPSA
jgi:hypothetical protein